MCNGYYHGYYTALCPREFIGPTLWKNKNSAVAAHQKRKLHKTRSGLKRGPKTTQSYTKKCSETNILLLQLQGSK